MSRGLVVRGSDTSVGRIAGSSDQGMFKLPGQALLAGQPAVEDPEH